MTQAEVRPMRGGALLAGRRKIMGSFPVPKVLKVLGWAATGVMGAATLVMLATAFLPHR